MYYFECNWLLRMQLKVLSLEEFTFLLSQVKERSDFWDCLEVKQFHNFSHAIDSCELQVSSNYSENVATVFSMFIDIEYACNNTYVH